MKEPDILKRAIEFAVKIICLANKLPKTPAGYRIGGQIIGSGTSIGANIHEAQSAVSKSDFINKMNIALKEARETLYWLIIIEKSKLIDFSGDKSLKIENDELIRIITTIIKNTKKNNKSSNSAF